MKNSKQHVLILFFLMFSFFLFSSCTKKSDDVKTDDVNKNVEMIAVDENDITESDEDLLTVDYKEFYDDLAPHGEWIQVTAKDLGLEGEKSSSSINSDNNKSVLSKLGLVKDAYASIDIDVGAFFVWKPSENMSVSIASGEPQPYRPYSNGQWINTDAGWYFKAVTPQEEITHHYGRWVYTPALGWTWVPGRVWAPAWVEWRESPDVIAWTPIPPRVYIVNNVFTVPPIVDDYRYTIVEKRYFVEPSVYKYHYMYLENKNKIMIKEMIKRDGIIVKNKTIINKGPEVVDIEKSYGKKIDVVRINRVNIKNEVKYSNTEINVYNPRFSKVKSKEKIESTVSKPKSFEKYGEEKVKKEGKESKEQEKELKKEEKELRKEEKELKKEEKKEFKKEEKKEEKKEFKKEEKKEDKKEMKKEGKDKKSDDGTKYKDNGKKNDKGKSNDGKDKGDKGKK